MLRGNSEIAVRWPRRLLIPIAMVGTLALALSACGRKGPLDPPPGGYALNPATLSTPVTPRGAAREPEPQAQPQYDENGRPIAPKGQKKRLPGDWLID
jgi:predicted small lipoprotein YifL